MIFEISITKVSFPKLLERNIFYMRYQFLIYVSSIAISFINEEYLLSRSHKFRNIKLTKIRGTLMPAQGVVQKIKVCMRYRYEAR